MNLQVVGYTAMVKISTFFHGPRQHRDPAVEVFNQPEIIFTLEDRWALRTPRGEAVAHPGMVILANRNEEYSCRHFEAVPRDRTFGVAFVGLARPEGGILSEWLEQQGEQGQPLFGALALPLTPDLRWYLQALDRETRDKVPGFRLKLDGLSSALLVDVVRLLGGDDRLERFSRRNRRRTAEALEQTRCFMDGHFSEDLDLATVAGVAGLSPFHFGRLFKEFTGQSPHQYLLLKRLELAATLLRETELRVTEVALSVGFQDVTNFARAFRRHTGLSPSHYRRRPEQD